MQPDDVGYANLWCRWCHEAIKCAPIDPLCLGSLILHPPTPLFCRIPCCCRQAYSPYLIAQSYVHRVFCQQGASQQIMIRCVLDPVFGLQVS